MFEIGLSYIHQHEDTDELGDDEPYVIIFAADLADTGLIPVPAARTVLNGPFEVGGVIGFPVSPELCWGFNGQPRDIDDANNPLILVGLMESDHDDDPPDFANGVRAGTHAIVNASLINKIVDLNAGNLDLATLRNQLVDDMRGALDIFKQSIEFDERLGPVQLLTVTPQDLVDLQSGTVEKKLRFVSDAEDSDYELTFKLGTGVGSVSSNLTRDPGPTDRYAAIWSQETGPDWVARHRLTSDEYQAEFDNLASQGFRLKHISGYNVAGAPRFAAIWDKSTGPDWVARHNMTAGQYQDEFNRRGREGYRLVQVSVYRGLGQDLYAAIWIKESKPAWVARHRMTNTTYQHEFNNLIQDGFRLVDVSGCRIGGEARYAAIWEQRSGPAWVARHGMRSAEYQQEFERLGKDGYRLIHVDGYTIGSKRRFAAIWEHGEGPGWVARHNLTSDQYQEQFELLGRRGYRLTCVSGY